MNNKPENVVKVLKSMDEYNKRFKDSFPGEADPVTFDNFAKAIEVYEATLTTPNSKFDKYLGGDAAALNDVEKQGLALFVDKGCATCHSGVNFGGTGYFPFGLVQKPGAEILPPNDKGRFAVTKTASEQYVFQAAPLRNIELTAPYFHSGQVWDLEQAVAVMGTAQLGKEITDDETKKIATFLRTLTGQQPKVEYPILPVETANTPKPVL